MNDTKEVNPKDMAASTRVRFSSVPMNVVAEAALGMTEGMSKYGRHNYRVAGARASVQYDAVMRHVSAWWEGEDTDAKSGLSHVTKAITALLVLRDCMMRGIMIDDRPPASAPFMDAFNEESARIIVENTKPDVVHWTNEMYQAQRAGKVGVDTKERSAVGDPLANLAQLFPKQSPVYTPRIRGGFTPD